jgi:hypothetical protein
MGQSALRKIALWSLRLTHEKASTLKKIAFAPAAIPVFGTKAVDQALALRSVARRESSSHLNSHSLGIAMILSWLMFPFFFWSPAFAQSEPVAQQPRKFNLPDAPEPPLGAAAQPQQQTYGRVSGTIVDQTGKGVAGADVKIMRDQESIIDEVQSDDDGQFTFAHVSPGPLLLTIVAEGFSTQMISGALRPGEDYLFPPIMLSLATQTTEIHVSPSTEETAQEQLEDLEKQRVLGIVPNFYVSYVSEAAALSSKQKFRLVLKAATDPVTITAVGVIAGVNQAADRFSGYSQGAQGYAKRFGASYGNFASGLFIGGAVLPSLFKQDPRYFYKGTGTKRSRLLYAVTRTVICKGDDQRWQPNYSSVLGDLAAGGISNLYIPERDRHGAALTFENAAIALGTTAAINVLQEFVLHKITSKRQ